MKAELDRQFAQLSDLIDTINQPLDKLDRKKLITLCTIDVHARDVVQRLIDERVDDSMCFPWQSQLRCAGCARMQAQLLCRGAGECVWFAVCVHVLTLHESHNFHVRGLNICVILGCTCKSCNGEYTHGTGLYAPFCKQPAAAYP